MLILETSDSALEFFKFCWVVAVTQLLSNSLEDGEQFFPKEVSIFFFCHTQFKFIVKLNLKQRELHYVSLKQPHSLALASASFLLMLILSMLRCFKQQIEGGEGKNMCGALPTDLPSDRGCQDPKPNR